MKKASSEILKGIIVPLVTPLSDNGEIDKSGLKNLIEHVIQGGVHGIFILGTTGEAQSLSKRQREEMIYETSRIVENRLPLLVGISDTSIGDSILLAQKAKEAGAYAVVATAPYYFAVSQSELIAYFENLIDRLPLPLFLYNMPAHTKVTFDPETIKHLAQHDQVVGFKDSSANGTYLHTVIYTMKENPDFMIFVGPEEMTAEMVLMGINGGVNGGANLFPELYVELYDAARKNDIEKVKMLQQTVMHISSGIYGQGNEASGYLRGLKCALSIAGICHDFLAMPFRQFQEEYRSRIKKEMTEIKKKLDARS